LYRYLFFFGLLFGATGPIVAQRYLNLQVDNDLYFGTDYYYSSGIFVDYGYRRTAENTTQNNTKRYARWRLGQEIYTPSRRYSTDLSSYDYPYSGYLFLQHQREYALSNNQGLQWGLQVGVSGNASLAKALQNIYHQWVLDLPKLAWLSAQPQRFHGGVLASYHKGWSLFRGVGVISKMLTELTTHRVLAQGQFGLLLGNAARVPYQDFLLLQQQKSWGIYMGTRQEYRPHDFPIEGSLFDDASPFVMTSNRYRNHFEMGLILNYQNWRLLGIFQSASKDVDLQRQNRHKYLNFTITRFL